MKLKSFSHSHGESSFHIVFAPKYRHAIFEDEKIKEKCEELFYEVGNRHNIEIRALKIMEDHVHLFVALKPWQCPSDVVHKFKGYSAYKLFRMFPELKIREPGKRRFWGGHFWSSGYFFRSVGSTTDRAVEFYIKISQDKELRDKYYVSESFESKGKMGRESSIKELKCEIDGVQTNLGMFCA